jgi:hypothetical protein
VIEEGQQAPDFELPDQDGNAVRLSAAGATVLGVSPDPVRCLVWPGGAAKVLSNVKPKQHDELVLAAL